MSLRPPLFPSLALKQVTPLHLLQTQEPEQPLLAPLTPECWVSSHPAPQLSARPPLQMPPYPQQQPQVRLREQPFPAELQKQAQLALPRSLARLPLRSNLSVLLRARQSQPVRQSSGRTQPLWPIWGWLHLPLSQGLIPYEAQQSHPDAGQQSLQAVELSRRSP